MAKDNDNSNSIKKNKDREPKANKRGPAKRMVGDKSLTKKSCSSLKSSSSTASSFSRSLARPRPYNQPTQQFAGSNVSPKPQTTSANESVSQDSSRSLVGTKSTAAAAAAAAHSLSSGFKAPPIAATTPAPTMARKPDSYEKAGAKREKYE